MVAKQAANVSGGASANVDPAVFSNFPPSRLADTNVGGAMRQNSDATQFDPFADLGLVVAYSM